LLAVILNAAQIETSSLLIAAFVGTIHYDSESLTWTEKRIVVGYV